MYRRDWDKDDYQGIEIDDTSWIKREFENMSVGDERIIKRAISSMEAAAAKPNESIPEVMGGNWNDIKATYNLFNNDKLNPDIILSGHRQETLSRIKSLDDDTVLIIQDTTGINYSSHGCVELGNHSSVAGAKGILMHSALAVTEKGLPLGILYQKFWSRKPPQEGRNHQKLPISEKESLKWFTALDESTYGIPSNKTAITICDREAEIYEFFLKGLNDGKHLLIRSCKNRLVKGEHRTLLEELAHIPWAGETIIKVPRNTRDNIPSREVRCRVKFHKVTIKPPHILKQSSKLPNLDLYSVLIEEVGEPPKGCSPLYWLLLTTLCVNTVEDALKMVYRYTQRWRIERFHLALKSGCKVEDLQLETFERLANAISFYSVIAWKILWLTYEAREHPDELCTKILKTYEWQALHCLYNKTKILPDKPPTIKEAVRMIAKLGGFIGRKSDGEPGVIVIWRGLSRLDNIANLYLTLTNPFPSNNVGNA